MLEKQEEGRDSQFLYGCDTDWNLNHEFICWLGYWFKKHKERARIHLDFHKFEYKGKELTQGEIIDMIIALCDDVNKDYYEFEPEIEEKVREEVDEIFDLFKLVYWAMWW